MRAFSLRRGISIERASQHRTGKFERSPLFEKFTVENIQCEEASLKCSYSLTKEGQNRELAETFAVNFDPDWPSGDFFARLKPF